LQLAPVLGARDTASDPDGRRPHGHLSRCNGEVANHERRKLADAKPRRHSERDDEAPPRIYYFLEALGLVTGEESPLDSTM
jgi:hypothetical protein